MTRPVVYVDPTSLVDGACWTVVYRYGREEVRRERFGDEASARHRAHCAILDRTPYQIHIDGPEQ